MRVESSIHNQEKGKTMDLAVISLIVLLLVIVISYVSKINIGLLSLVAAIIMARVGGISDAAMYKSINLNVFWTLIGIYFFGQCMTSTGTLALFSKKLISKLPIRAEIWPIIAFVFTFCFAFLGPTTVLALTLVPLITIEIAAYIGANIWATMVLTAFGGIAGRMTPLGGNLAGQLAVAEGLGFTETAEMSRIFLWDHVLVCTILGIIYYFVFKGYKKEKVVVGEVEALKDIPPFSKKQIVCLISMFAFVLFYVVTQWHIGFVAIIFTVILIATGCVDQKDIIDKTKWGTVIMVCGAGILASIAQELGGMALISDAIAYVSNLKIVACLYSIASGVLSMFTHAMSVPIPILFATVEETLTALGGSREQMFTCLAAIGSSAYVGMICPMSLAGANVFACWSSVMSPDAKEQQKQFTKQMILAFVSVILAGIINIFTLPLFI